jgi:hypothetical protein
MRRVDVDTDAVLLLEGLAQALASAGKAVAASAGAPAAASTASTRGRTTAPSVASSSLPHATVKRGKGRGALTKKRLRSRNTVVDAWLVESGSDDEGDTYADLEQFIVTNEDDIL